MTKRSHQIASRQAAISRERKRKKKSQPAEKTAEQTVSPIVDASASSSSTVSDATPASVYNVSTKSVQSLQLDENRYQNVIKDLRMIAIIAAPLVIILIILAFVL